VPTPNHETHSNGPEPVTCRLRWPRSGTIGSQSWGTTAARGGDVVRLAPHAAPSAHALGRGPAPGRPDGLGAPELVAGRHDLHPAGRSRLPGQHPGRPHRARRPYHSGLAGEDVLVVVTTGQATSDDLQRSYGEPLPVNTRVCRFVPYDLLMPHLRCFVTNGGYTAVTLALHLPRSPRASRGPVPASSWARRAPAHPPYGGRWSRCFPRTATGPRSGEVPSTGSSADGGHGAASGECWTGRRFQRWT